MLSLNYNKRFKYIFYETIKITVTVFSVGHGLLTVLL